MEKVSITQFLTEHIPDLIAIYQFGSQVHGTARPDSDIDLAVLALTRTPAERLFHLAQELAIQLGRNVDLLDLRSMAASGNICTRIKRSRMPSSAIFNAHAKPRSISPCMS